MHKTCASVHGGCVNQSYTCRVHDMALSCVGIDLQTWLISSILILQPWWWLGHRKSIRGTRWIWRENGVKGSHRVSTRLVWKRWSCSAAARKRCLSFCLDRWLIVLSLIVWIVGLGQMWLGVYYHRGINSVLKLGRPWWAQPTFHLRWHYQGTREAWFSKTLRVTDAKTAGRKGQNLASEWIDIQQ